MEIKTYAPVIIPTLNRYTHFKRCIESLSRCTLAEKTIVVVGLDYPPSGKYVDGFEKIKSYLSDCGNLGFKELRVVKRDHNYGAEKNWNDLQKSVLDKHNTVICTEDDNEFSPCFLDFMNKALDRFRFDEHVTSISGYNNEMLYNQGEKNWYYSSGVSAWGLGLWGDKENKIKPIIIQDNYIENILLNTKLSIRFFIYRRAIFNSLIQMLTKHLKWGDLLRSSYNFLNITYQVRPAVSMVRNLGNDGSGLHCSVNDLYLHQTIHTSDFFEFNEGVEQYSFNENYYRNETLSKNKVKRLIKSIILIVSYIKFRLLYKN